MAQWMSTDKYTVQLDFDIQNGLEEVAETLAKLAYRVATHEDGEVSHYRTGAYMSTHNMLKQAIRAAYPYRDTERIYDLWVDCGESIAYCATSDYLQVYGMCRMPGCRNETDIDPEDGGYKSTCSRCFYMGIYPNNATRPHIHMRTTLDGINYPTLSGMIPTWDNGTQTGWACTGMDVQGPCGYWAPID